MNLLKFKGDNRVAAVGILKATLFFLPFKIFVSRNNSICVEVVTSS